MKIRVLFSAAGLMAVAITLGTLALGATQSGGSRMVSLSPSLQIGWNESLKPRVTPISSVRSFRLEGESQGKPYSVFIRGQAPDTVANAASVKRMWQASLKATRQLGEETEDLGCKEIQPHAFRCDGVASNAKGEFIAQALVWAVKSDLAAIRVSSRVSREEARAVLGALQFKIQTRVPAGARRGK